VKTCAFCPSPIRGSTTTPSEAPVWLPELRIWLCKVCRYTVRRTVDCPPDRVYAATRHANTKTCVIPYTDVLAPVLGRYTQLSLEEL
jgi:hypothetical protein